MLNRKFWSLSTAAAVSMALGACTSLPVTTDYNPRVGIGVCHTYGWATEHYRSAGQPAAFSNPINGERLRAAIEANLNARGLQPVAAHAQPDCMVGFAIGSRVVADEFANVGFGVGYGYGWGRRWGGWGGFGAYDYPPVRNEGRISVDLFEVQSHMPIWHASVDENVGDMTGSDAEARINAAATAIFTKFPIAAPLPAASRATT
jgi:hypothetical protein